MYILVSYCLKEIIYGFRTAGLFPAILGKDPWPKLGKNDRLNSKIGRNKANSTNLYPPTKGY